MLFTYHALDKDGHEREGTIDALSMDVAVSALQRRELIISSIEPTKKKGSLLTADIAIFQHVSNKEVVILSRQISTLFTAQVSALRVFRLLASEMDNKLLADILTKVADDLQGGSAISQALARHPKVFSTFYVNMVRAGEESGKLSDTFNYLADYLDRTYALVSKAQNALIYPAFVIFTFFAVMILMLTFVIPRVSAILVDSGQPIPVYTQIILNLSNFLIHYGLLALIVLIGGGILGWRSLRTSHGRYAYDHFKISLPYLGDLYQKLYLSRIADNLSTMLLSGVPVVDVIDITANVIDNAVYQDVLHQTRDAVRGGSTISAALAAHPEVIPGIMTAMIKVGEETGELGSILTTLSKFYSREVMTAVDTLVDLIEPMMIVLLGVGVGVLLASVLVPIYNLANAF
ncbi:MAG: hypothetical protein B7X04_01745 [Parcubacteria group bacterium 21-54-25]|nr:MAG: hypothetical protein B7X04_01745 [Parcubacteria group bacterium 21-54-25]HQU07701.1 type II secretion system F family protein [Candidatus Paceibacterota bacterium]